VKNNILQPCLLFIICCSVATTTYAEKEAEAEKDPCSEETQDTTPVLQSSADHSQFNELQSAIQRVKFISNRFDSSPSTCSCIQTICQLKFRIRALSSLRDAS